MKSIPQLCWNSIAVLAALPLVSAVEVLRVDFDANPSSETYVYGWAGYKPVGEAPVDSSAALVYSGSTSNAVGVSASNAFQGFANSTDVGPPPGVTLEYAYWGLGLNTSNALTTTLSSPDLSDYRLSIVTQVVGLNSGETQSNGIVDVDFLAPDDTLQPADGDTNPDRILSVRYPLVLKPSLTVSDFRLTTPLVYRNGTSLATFQAHHAAVTGISIRPEIQEGWKFGNDDGNELIVDELVLFDESLTVPPVEQSLLLIDFDTNGQGWGGSWFSYAGWGDPHTPIDLSPLVRDSIISDTDGVNGGKCRRDTVDTSAWAGANNPVPEGKWSYLGHGNTIGKWPNNSPMAVSDKLSEYAVDFEVKSTGYAWPPNGKLVLEILVPDDLLGVDAGTDGDILLRIRFDNSAAFTYPNETFQKFRRMLTDGNLETGSLAAFEQYHDQVQGFTFQFETAGTVPQPGFDADNASYFDNIELLRISPAVDHPFMITQISTSPTQVALTFNSKPGNLYSIRQSLDLSNFDTEIGQVTATGASTTFIHQQALSTKEFFRIHDLGVAPLPQ